MGGDFVEPGGTVMICEGSDVLQQLNDVFGDPTSSQYIQAQKKKDEFLKVKNEEKNAQCLIDAYKAVGLNVSRGWEIYLRRLGSVQPQGPQNIYDIAQFRYNGLTDGTVMLTIVHVPQNGGHVHTQRGTEAGLHSQVSSPCPM
jgi:hypothetical protein